MPNVFVIFILFIGLFYSRMAGVVYGVIIGLLIDLFVGRNVGTSAIMLGAIGLIGGIFDKNFSKESRLTIMIMVVICTIIYEVGSYVIEYALLSYTFEILNFIKILVIECLYNVLITVIFYPLIRTVGYKLEDEFKGNKILTRYF